MSARAAGTPSAWFSTDISSLFDINSPFFVHSVKSDSGRMNPGGDSTPICQCSQLSYTKGWSGHSCLSSRSGRGEEKSEKGHKCQAQEPFCPLCPLLLGVSLGGYGEWPKGACPSVVIVTPTECGREAGMLQQVFTKGMLRLPISRHQSCLLMPLLYL